MKISIAMCTYNGSAYVQEQLESIKAQTRPPDELIICDDASGDNTVAIVRKFAAASRFPTRCYVNEKTLGSTRNFEKAITLCEGDVIALADQDDVWYAEKLERAEAVFLAKPAAGLVFTNGAVSDDQLHPLGYSLWQCFGFSETRQQQMKSGKAYEVLLLNNVVTGATLAFQSRFKSLVLPLPIENNLIHDGWIALLIACVAELEFIPEPLIQYRLHAKQQMGASRVGFLERLKRARRAQAASQLKVADSFAQARARLYEFTGEVNQQALKKIEEKIAHACARGNLPRRRLSRLPSATRELLARRYARYSEGFFSFARDLLL